jgi:transcriptional regulator with XRE-family HTH domain
MAQETLRQLIRRYRTEKKLTQEALAKELEVSHTFISKIETGEQDPSYTKLAMITHVLEIPWREVLATGELKLPYMYHHGENEKDDDILFMTYDKHYAEFPPRVKLMLYEIGNIIEKYVE